MTNKPPAKGSFTNKNFYQFVSFIDDSSTKKIKKSNFWRWGKVIVE